MRRWLYVLPVIVFGLMAAGFYVGLGIDNNVLPSALINEPAPQFDLPPLPGRDKGFRTADLQGHVSLVNTFASWCAPCRMEHPVLNALAKTKRVPIYGINYKDKGDAALSWITAATLTCRSARMTGRSASSGGSTACPRPLSSIRPGTSATSMWAR